MAGTRRSALTPRPARPAATARHSVSWTCWRAREAEPADLADGQERSEPRRAGVAQLPDFLRQVLVMAYYQGLKYREIADVLGIPVGTVKSRLHAALVKLQEAWSQRPPCLRCERRFGTGLAFLHPPGGGDIMHPLDDNLVGYLLNALDDDSRRSVEVYLPPTPQRRKLARLQELLAPLAADRDEVRRRRAWPGQPCAHARRGRRCRPLRG